MGNTSTGQVIHKVWIDLDNSPHVPFFNPIIAELKKRDCRVMLTARDAYQVCELADLFGFSYVRLGRHYGKNKIMKAAGTVLRSLELIRFAIREKPDLAVSHGSRSQLLAAAALGIPSVMMMDYEFVAHLPGIQPTWLMTPDVVPANSVTHHKNEVMRYPGIKEDVYTATFQPDPNFRHQLGIAPEDLLVTLRPPASEAHYHNPESDALLKEVVNRLATMEAKVIVVPRNGRQESALRGAWPHLFSQGNFMIPNSALDGLNLIWHSDLVISGGGTMNREAAALGVPVYSIFRGQIGAVDRHLAKNGRLVLLETVEDAYKKLKVERRIKLPASSQRPQESLRVVVENILSVLTPVGSQAISREDSGPLADTVR